MENPFFVVALGGSAGSLYPLFDFFEHLKNVNGAAFVVVPHLTRRFPSQLDKLLKQHSQLPVVRVNKTTLVEPDTIYVLPESCYMTLENSLLHIHQRPEEETINRAVDIFLESMATSCGNRAVAVILSGMGQDGLKGVKAVHKAGGIVLVQDPRSTEFTSMPEAAIKGDHPAAVLPPGKLALILSSYLSGRQRLKAK